MKLKKIIAYISAIAMLTTSAITASAYTYVQNRYYKFPFTVLADDMQPGEYVIDAARGIKWVYEQGSDANGKKGRCAIKTDHAATGNNSLYVMGNDVDAGNSLGAKMSIHFGELTGNGTYTIQFDASHWNDYAEKDYATLNMANWDNDAQLINGSAWTKSTEFAGSNGSKQYMTYTATMSTTEAPVLNFGAFGWGAMLIDNIVIKDSTGTVVFEENFEGGIPEGWVEPDEPDEPEEEIDMTRTYAHGKYYNFPFTVLTADMNPGEYVIDSAKGIKWVYEQGSDAKGTKGRCAIKTDLAATGNNSLYVMGNDVDAGKSIGAKMSLYFGELTGNGTYTIQFDMSHWNDGTGADFATLNMSNWNSTAQLTNGSAWIKSEEFAGSIGKYNYRTYTATMSTTEAPVLNFGAFGWGAMLIDNIIIKDSTGKVVFSEGFEGKGIPHEIIDVDKTMSGGVEVASPVEDYVGQNVPAGTYESESDPDVKYVITYGSGAYGKVTYGTSAYGNSSFFLYGADNNVGGTTGSARITLKLGQKTADNKYAISFDIARNSANSSDYATLNEEDWSGSAKLTGTSKWSTISRGAIGTGNKEWTHYYATLSTTSDPQLDFSVFGWGAMCIDNIVVKDTDGNIIFAEGFECGEPPAIIDVEYTTVDGEKIDSPVRPYIGKNVPNKTHLSERNANVAYTPTYGNGAFAKVSNTVSAGGTNSLYLYGADNTAADGKGSARITLELGTRTADNKYVISFDTYREHTSGSDYVALNEGDWEGNARLGSPAMWASSSRGTVGNGNKDWTHYVATLITEADPKLDFAVFGWGAMYIDNIVVRDTDGNVIFSEGFEGTELPVGMSQIIHTTSAGEKIDCAIDEYIGEKVPAGEIGSWKKPTVKYVATYGDGGYAKVDSTIAAYGENSLKLFGADKNVGGTTGSARLTLKLGEKTSDNNYVISFDVYREVTDSRDYITLNEWNWESTARLDNGTLWNKTVLGTAGKGDKNWTHYEATLTTVNNPQLDISVFGWGVLYIDNIVIKDTSENIVFSEGFEDSGFARSVIYDAEFKLVEKADDGYTVVGVANALTSNTFVKASVKIENMAAQKGAKGNIYTALYKDKLLISFDAQTISASKGEVVVSNSVCQIPSLDDGEYTLKVFVWDDNLNALKDVMLIGE